MRQYKYAILSLLFIYFIKPIIGQINNQSLPVRQVFHQYFSLLDNPQIDAEVWKDRRWFNLHSRFFPAGAELQYYDFFDNQNPNSTDCYKFSYNPQLDLEYLALTARRANLYAKVIDWHANDEVELDGKSNFRKYDFKSGELDSRQPYKYGIFSLKFKAPYGYGFWPAFWLYGAEGDEIDVFEIEGNDPTRFPTNYHCKTCGTNTGYSANNSIFNFTTGIYIAMLEWQPATFADAQNGYTDELKWYIFPTGQAPLAPSPTTPYYRRVLLKNSFNAMQIMLNLAVGGAPFPDRTQIENAAFPSAFEIYSINVYHRYDETKTITLNEYGPNIGLPKIPPTVYTAGAINVSPNANGVTVKGPSPNYWNESSYLELYASTITINPGFLAEYDSYFKAGQVDDRIRNSRMDGEEKLTTLIVDKINSFDFKVFPSPSSGIINLAITFNDIQQKCDIKVYNMLGVLVKQLFFTDVFEVQKIIDLSNLSNGVYTISVGADNQNTRKTILLSK